MTGNRSVSTLTAATLVFLGFVQALWPVTMDLYLPSFPQIAAELRASPDVVSLTLTAAFVGMAVGQLTAGPLSDRVGRMRPFVAALAVYTVATTGCASAQTIEILIACRAGQGLGASAAAVITLAIVRDCATGSRMVRLLARLQLINGVFVVLAPALGALLLGTLDWRGLFWSLVVFGCTLLIVISSSVARRETLVRERRRSRELRVLAADYRALASDRGYLVALISNSLLWAGMMGYMSSSSFVFQGVFAFEPMLYAVVFGAHGAVMIVAAQGSALLTRRFGIPPVVFGGAIAAALSALAFVLAVTVTPPRTLAAFLIPLFGFTGSFGVLSPCLQAVALERHGDRAGTAASVLGASSMIAGALAAPLVASFGVESVQPVSIFLALTALAAVAVILSGRAAHPNLR